MANVTIDFSTKVWLSEKEACAYTSLSPRSLHDAREDAKITFRQMGRKIIYRREDLDKFIERHSDLYKSAEDFLRDNASRRKR